MKITGLQYIGNNGKDRISNIIKSDPYIASIEVYKEDKNGQIVKKSEVLELFKSKKECIVGYRPEMILLKGFDKNEDNRMFRLLPNEGLYIDNGSFKSNFEDKYTIKKMQLEEIKELVKDVPFELSMEAKNILRNGITIQNYIKTIYENGMEKMPM